MKAAELQGPALEWAVRDCEFHKRLENREFIKESILENHREGHGEPLDAATAEAIILREGIIVVEGNPLYFPAGNEKGERYEPLWIAGGIHGRTRIEAAMRFYVHSYMGSWLGHLPQGMKS